MKITGLSYEILSAEEIEKISVCQVLYSEAMVDGMPKESGLLDSRMGTVDNDMICATCSGTVNTCNGHYGHIELHKPVINGLYINKIKKILETICYYCGDYKDLVEDGGNIEKAWKKLKSKKICIFCSQKQPIIRKEGLNLLIQSRAGRTPITNEYLYELFSKKNSYFRNLLIKNLLVVPPCARPSINIDGVLRAEDDLTHKLSDIIKANNLCLKQEEEGAPLHILREYEELLQFHVNTYMDNENSKLPQSLQKSGRPIKSIASRIKGKEGRMRGNLMGKRVDFSARSVITAEPYLPLDGLGVPLPVAMGLTIPERVNYFNKERLTELCKSGPTNHPGANYIIREDGTRIDLRYNSNIELENNWIVERHLTDGDIVSFNRQPSLHKMSMMAHRVFIRDGLSFKLNLSTTTPYNADFDGDEMNLHVPQSLLSKSELQNIMHVRKNIISPQQSKPIMAIVQDSLIGIYRSSTSFISKGLAFSLLYSVNRKYIKPAILRPKNIYTGKQMLSTILYKRLFYNKDDLLIVDGNIISGKINKKIVGSAKNSLIHIIYLDKGSKKAMEFINNIQRMVNEYLINTAFTCGIGDLICPVDTLKDISTTIQKSILDVKEKLKDVRNGRLSRKPGLSLEESFELIAMNILNKVRDTAGKMANNSMGNNNIKQMIEAGSKGSLVNLSQMSACVGQQTVIGKRIAFGMMSNRTLPLFTINDRRAKSRGFIENSYLTGLNVDEFFFHAMGGREGLIDTACKTAETGYMQRRLIKALENLRVENNYMVKDGISNNIKSVVQFQYGDANDAFRAENIEDYKFKVLDIGQYENPYDCNLMSENQYMEYENNLILNIGSIEEETEYTIPLNIDRILSYYKSDNKINLKVFIQMKHELMRELNAILKNAYIHKLIFILIDYKIHSELNISKSDFSEIIKIVVRKVRRGFIDPMEMVGTVAAQSLGEPATQMTLNTFHYAGVASNVTMGVPRLKEIINVSKNIKTPSMKIYSMAFCQKGVARDNCFLHGNNGMYEKYNKLNHLRFAKDCRSEMERSVLSDLLIKADICFDKDHTKSVFEEDNNLIDLFNELEMDDRYLSNYVIRFVFDREKLIFSSLSIENIVQIINKNSEYNIIHSDMNDDELVIRIRPVILNEAYTHSEIFELMKESECMHLKGIENIKKLFFTDKDNIYSFRSEGTALHDILQLSFVDKINTVTNDLIEIYEILGIEAVRSAIVNELRIVIESDGGRVGYRHLYLLADSMTSDGKLRGITRHGFNKRSISIREGDKNIVINNTALKRASFEQTVEILAESAFKNEYNRISTVSDAISVGNSASLGTGAIEVELNMREIRKIKDIEVEIYSDESEMDDISIEEEWSPKKKDEIYKPSYSPLSPTQPKTYSMATQKYSPKSPKYSPTSVRYSPSSPKYSPRSPNYSPKSPKYKRDDDQ